MGSTASPLDGPDDLTPPRGLPFPLVGVGASAGGLEAITQLLRELPSDPGMAFVIIQHLDPHHESQLTELLREATEMPVQTVKDGTTVQANNVYVIPPNADVVISDGHLRLAPRKSGLHLPIDTFFTSLAQTQGSRAVGIVLSGNASDGSQGIRAIKGEFGLTFAQDESSARHSGMPRNAAATGAVDFILPPEEIARELIRVSRHPYVVPQQPDAPEEALLPEGDGDLHRIFRALQDVTNVDFSHYKQNTIRRRIGRRMVVHRITSLAEYALYVDKHVAEVRELYRDLLISVTNFFREEQVFVRLMQLLSDVLKGRKPDEPLRMWVPGCATGEEVYTLAICAQELLDGLKRSTRIQIFGTDISELALERARSGIYPGAIAQDVSAERLRRFFVHSDGSFQIAKTIREKCVFARQDLTSDPPFAHTDVISCRNVLIYLDSDLQRRTLPVFHYSLNPTGFLVLGGAETIAPAADLFSVIDQQHRIYGRKPVAVRFTLSPHLSRGPAESSHGGNKRSTLSGAELQKKVDRIIQTTYSPAGVVVDAELQILHFRGDTSVYLNPVPGEATLNLLRMVREGMVVPLRRAIEAAAEKNVPVRQTAIQMQGRGEQRKVDIEVTPISGASASDRYFLIVFEEPADAAHPAPETSTELAVTEPVAGSGEQVRELQRQLSETREYLRNLTQEYEASTEELRASNEEVRSSNEELQSTNEELGTTKEELQSANEELTTVNDELQSRNQELDALNNDLINLLSAINIPVLMVDGILRLRRFNAAAEKIFDLTRVDVGRPITHMRGSIEVSDLDQIVHRVLETLGTESREVQDHSGRWYSVTVRPYRTADNRIDGAVVIFIDIDPMKRSLKLAEEARDYAEGMIETVREPMLVLDSDLRIQRATSNFYQTFQVSRGETLGRLLYDLGNGQWNQARLRELLGDALFRNQSFQDYEIEHDFPHIGLRRMRLNGSPIPPDGSQFRTVLLSIEDVTERRHEAEIRHQRLFETSTDGILVMDAETGLLVDANPYVLELTGYSREDFVGKYLPETPPFRSDVGRRVLTEVLGSTAVRHDASVIAKSGQNIDIEVIANHYTVGNQRVVQVNIRDITSRKKTERALQESEERFRLFVGSVRDYAMFQLDLEGRITTWNPGAEGVLGYTEQEILGQPGARLFTPEDRASGQPEKEIETARSEGRAMDERWHLRKDGRRFYASGVLTAIRDQSGQLRGFAKIMRDTTEAQQFRERLQKTVKEKEVLLREIHHRVKNNLQVITSLLELQSHYTGDPQVLGFTEQMHNRVRSIATIHEMLYASTDLTKVDFGAYAVKMANNLFAFYGVDSERVALHADVHETSLDIDRAIPCGLILNELLTNCLRHGFPDGRTGTISISFDCTSDSCVMAVANDGISLPAAIEPTQATSMGLRLVNLLVDQLQGTLQVERDNGTRFVVSFPL